MSGSGDPGLDALVRAWTSRPVAEVAAFVGSLGPVVTEPPAVDRDSLEALRAVAAVSGALRPGDLVAGVADGVRTDELLAGLSAEFDRAVIGTRMTWTMRTHARSTTMRRLGRDPSALADSLRRAAEVPTDEAGEVVRRIIGRLSDPSASPLLGRLPDEVIGDAPNAAIAQALLWASELGDLRASNAWAACRAHYGAILGSYLGLLSHGLVGREAQRQRVEAFVDGSSGDAGSTEDPSPPWDTNGSLPVLTLTGIGGAGKSTLLADVLRPRLEALLSGQSAPAVIVIDLDRVAFRPHAGVELSYEVTRQLEVAWPELAEGLADARVHETQSRLDRREFAGGTNLDVESSTRSSYSFESIVRQLVTTSPRRDEPVVLVLDTFEEWQRARPIAGGPRATWNDPDQVMSNWLLGLRDGMGLGGLRVVVSGRAPFDGMAGHEVRLDDLSAASAAALLGRLGVEPDVGSRLAAVVGGNPLSLHVAARFVHRLSGEDRETFLADGALDSGLDEELRRAVLYDRFLEHIADEDVRRLAHPGLALRRVTTDLVREVLAGPCGFTAMSEELANHLVDRLSDEVWLVRPAEDGSLRHQPEVRRAMLALMSRDPEMRGRVRAIHERAAQWYNPRPDLMEPATPENVEAFYHRMMLSSGEPPVFEGEWEAHGRPLTERNHLARFSRELGEAVAEMVPAVEAQLRLLRGDRITRLQADLLSPLLWQHYVDQEGPLLIEGESADAAVDLFRSRPWLAPYPPPSWLAQAYCDCARWDEYAAQGSRSTGRYDLVNRVAAQDPEASAPLLETTSVDGADPETAFLQAFAMGLARARWGRDVSQLSGLSASGFGRGVLQNPPFPVDQLRQYVVHRITGAPLRRTGDLPVFPDFGGLFVPDPSIMAAYANLTLDQDRVLLDISRDLGQLAERARTSTPGAPDGLRSHDVLGEFASMVSKRVGSQTRLSVGPLDEGSLRALRGDNPELRPAVRHALLAAAPDDQWLRTMGEVASALLPVPVLDLRPDALPLITEPTARTALLTLVEYVDRSRCLRVFLDALVERHPDPGRLDRLRGGFGRWDDAHLALLGELGRLTNT